MASLTAHVAVDALQRKWRATVVVEKRWLPLVAVVAISACGDASLRKLGGVRIGVTLFAFQRSTVEIRIHQLGAEICRLMAVNACHRPMSPDQRETGLCVVEPGNVPP